MACRFIRCIECRLWCSPVYEYPLNGQWIMLDMDDGYVLWTGIWKGLSFRCR